MKKARILYVEDDLYLSYVTKDNLELKGYIVDYFDDGASALNAFLEIKFDLCILDVMLPKMDGFTLAKRIREKNKEIPIIFLTAKSLKEDKIKGLKIGADDYIIKPFSIEELVLKIEIFLKRSKIANSFSNYEKYEIGTFILDFHNLLLKNDNEEQRLTLKEAELIKYFAENKGVVLKREEILEEVWGSDDLYLSRSLDVFISRLRKFFKKDNNIKIENLHGVGFKLKLG